MDIGELVIAGHDVTTTKYYYLAATTVLFYDVILTLPDEITFIWQSRKNFVSYLSLINRYGACAACISVHYTSFRPKLTVESCHSQAIVQLVQATVTIFIAQTFMMLRVYAMSGRKKYVCFGLSMWILAQFVFFLVVIALLSGSSGELPFPEVPSESFRICDLYPASTTIDFALIYMIVVYDITVFTTTMVYSFKTSWSCRMSRVLRTAIRDGALYFFFLLSMNLYWALSIQYAPPGLKSLTSTPNIILTSVMINRLNLSLHKANTKDAEGLQPESDYVLTTLSTAAVTDTTIVGIT